MSDTETIKDFLVSLGFKTDEVSQKKFASSIAWATVRVQTFVNAIKKAGQFVYDAGKKFVQGMENLYYVGARTGASVAGVAAFAFAAQHLGASAEEALGSLESIGHFMRTTPGAEGFIHSLGVQTRDANGQLRDTAETMIDIGKRLSHMDFPHANAYANVLGIDEHTLIALRSGEFEREFRKHQKLTQGTDFQKAAEGARNFSNKVRDVGAQFQVLGAQIETALFAKFGPQLDRLIAWLQEHGPAIAERVTQIVERLLNFADKAVPVVEKIFDFLVKADEATNGWSTTIIGLLAVLKLLGLSVFGVGGAIAGLLMNVTKLVSAMGSLTAKLGALSAAAYAGWEIGSKIYENFLEGTDAGDAIGNGVAHTLAFLGSKDAQDSIDLRARNSAPLGQPSPGGAVHIQQKTDIHVHGTDAQSTAQAVAREQNGVHQNLVRQFASAAH